jgi:hypothetical protein
MKAAFILTALFAATAAAQESSYTKWTNGPSRDANFFPIAVWLQAPQNADRFKAAGINTYVGLWEGPTEKQLADLNRAGMSVICFQNEIGLKHLADRTIIGWMHNDEPDNAQPVLGVARWGSPVASEKIVADYKKLAANDPTRPVMLNLGQGVAWDGWYGRGLRTNHPEDYPAYLKGCDIASFDIYPVVHDRDEVKGKLWFVPQGVDRLRKWSNDEKIVWNCIECTRISNTQVKPTPRQVETEAWMSIIHGSRGIIYFVHQFKPTFIEAALLEDPEMLAAVTKLNERITSLASVLNSPPLAGVSVQSSNPQVPVDMTARKSGSTTYVFAVCMRDGATNATISFPDVPSGATAEVLDESRTIQLKAGKSSDRFEPYAVHLYRIGGK